MLKRILLCCAIVLLGRVAFGQGAPGQSNYAVTLTGNNIFSSLATFDVSALPVGSFKLPSALTTGLVTVTGGTGAVSSVAVPAGAVVGSSDTQTLSNKTLNGAGSLNSIYLLCPMQTAAGAITGNSTALTVYTCTIPANVVGAARGFRIEVWFNCSTCTAAAKAFTWQFGAATVTYASDTGTNTGSSHAVLTCFNTTAQTAQHCAAESLVHAGQIVTGGIVNAAENLANADTVAFQFNAAATEQITPQMMVATLIQ